MATRTFWTDKVGAGVMRNESPYLVPRPAQGGLFSISLLVGRQYSHMIDSVVRKIMESCAIAKVSRGLVNDKKMESDGAILYSRDFYPKGLAFVPDYSPENVYQFFTNGKLFDTRQGLEGAPLLGLSGDDFASRVFASFSRFKENNYVHPDFIKKPLFVLRQAE